MRRSCPSLARILENPVFHNHSHWRNWVSNFRGLTQTRNVIRILRQRTHMVRYTWKPHQSESYSISPASPSQNSGYLQTQWNCSDSESAATPKPFSTKESKRSTLRRWLILRPIEKKSSAGGEMSTVSQQDACRHNPLHTKICPARWLSGVQ